MYRKSSTSPRRLVSSDRGDGRRHAATKNQGTNRAKRRRLLHATSTKSSLSGHQKSVRGKHPVANCATLMPLLGRGFGATGNVSRGTRIVWRACTSARDLLFASSEWKIRGGLCIIGAAKDSRCASGHGIAPCRSIHLGQHWRGSAGSRGEHCDRGLSGGGEVA